MLMAGTPKLKSNEALFKDVTRQIDPLEERVESKVGAKDVVGKNGTSVIFASLALRGNPSEMIYKGRSAFVFDHETKHMFWVEILLDDDDPLKPREAGIAKAIALSAKVVD